MRNKSEYIVWFLLGLLTGLGAGMIIVGHATKKVDAPTEINSQIQTGYVACTSAYYLDQYEQAPHRRQIGMMMDDECLPTDRLTDYPFMVMETGEVSRVRLLLPDDAYADVYLFAEAITPDRK